MSDNSVITNKIGDLEATIAALQARLVACERLPVTISDLQRRLQALETTGIPVSTTSAATADTAASRERDVKVMALLDGFDVRIAACEARSAGMTTATSAAVQVAQPASVDDLLGDLGGEVDAEAFEELVEKVDGHEKLLRRVFPSDFSAPLPVAPRPLPSVKLDANGKIIPEPRKRR